MANIDINCSVNCDCLEDRDHLFFKCDLFGRFWSLIFDWLGISMTFHGNLEDHLMQFGGLGGFSKNSRLNLNIIWLSVLCIIWKERNGRIFQHKVDLLQSLSENVKLHTFWWFKSY